MKSTIAQLLAMALLLIVGSWYLNPRDSHPASALRFTEIASSSGCQNVHSKVQLSRQFDNIMPWLSSVGAAVAAGDFDNDGNVDFYVTNSGRNSQNRLFRNLGNGRFEEVAARAGVADCNRDGACMDAVWFDYDNDGDEDLYVVKWGAKNILYENLGNGAFNDVTEQAGVGFWGYANGVIAFDYDRDGLLDLFVANYFADSLIDPSTGKMARSDLWNPVTTRIMHSTFTHAVNGGRNVLYKNLGNGKFKDITIEAGVSHTGWSLDAGAADLNNDGWPDLYVANDFGADELYFNTGASENPPRFRLVIDPDGHPGIGADWWKGMNVDIADVDGNGRMDIYITNILARKYKTDEGNMLWLNYADPTKVGGCKFINASTAAGTNDGGWGWGAKFCDFNNDGLMDILALNGFSTGPDPNKTYWYQLQEMVTQTRNNAADVKDWPVMGDRDLSGYETSRLFIQNDPKNVQPKKATQRYVEGSLPEPPHFTEMAVSSGMTDDYNGRGAALADIDNDGDVDVYIANQGAASCLYRNDLFTEASKAPDAHWLGLYLIGNPRIPRQVGDRSFATSIDALGTRVELWTNGVSKIAELTYCNGFASQSERRMHVGIGAAQKLDSVVVRWPSGRKDVFDGNALPVDHYHTIKENAGKAELALGSK